MSNKGFGEALYREHRKSLDTIEQVHAAQGLVEVPGETCGTSTEEQAVIDAMLEKQARLTKAHAEAMAEIRHTLGMPPRADKG